MRDDSFRSVSGGSVAWLEGASRSTAVKLHSFAGSTIFVNGFESGSTTSWSSSFP